MIRLFNNHLQTTEVSRNKRKLEKELRQDNSQRAKRAALTLADGLHENFRKRAVQANFINQLVSASPILLLSAVTSTHSLLLTFTTP